MRKPGTKSALSARRPAPTTPPVRAGGPVGPGGTTPASGCGLARGATKSRYVSRESKLKEHGDVSSVKGKTLRPAWLLLRDRWVQLLGKGLDRV